MGHVYAERGSGGETVKVGIAEELEGDGGLSLMTTGAVPEEVQSAFEDMTVDSFKSVRSMATESLDDAVTGWLTGAGLGDT